MSFNKGNRFWHLGVNSNPLRFDKEMTRDCGTDTEKKDDKKSKTSAEDKAKMLSGSAKPLCLPINLPCFLELNVYRKR